MTPMVAREGVGTPKGIRWSEDLEEKIFIAAKEDSRSFSDEVRELVKLGLQRRKKALAGARGE